MNFFWSLSVIIVLAISASCSDSPKINDTLEKEEVLPIPTLEGFPKSEKYVDTIEQLQSIVYPLFISKLEAFPHDSLKYVGGFFGFMRDSLAISNSRNFDVFVDTNQRFSDRFNYFRPTESLFGTIDKDGNRTPPKPYVPPYDSVMKLPVFVVNNSDSNQVIENHDSRIVMIQEALDKNGEWIPIEYFHFNWCGNARGDYLIEKGQILMFGVNQYRGNFKTKLRIRLKNWDKILYSNEYFGEINEEQLKLRETEYGIDWNEYLDLKKAQESN